MPYKVWAVGEEVLAADFNPMVQQQVVATFASTAARDAAIPAPVVGQCCHVTSIGLQIWNAATGWANYDAHVLCYGVAIAAAWGPLVGAGAATLATINIPAQPRPYALTAALCLTGINDVSLDRYQSAILVDGVILAAVVNRHNGAVEMNYSIGCMVPQAVAAGVAKSVTARIIRVAGTGTFSGSGSAVPVLTANVAYT